MKQVILIGFLILVPCKPKTTREPAMCADAVFINAKVAAAGGGFARAFSVKDGRFLHVGSTQEVLEQRCAATAVHDLQGRTVLPGLIDAHAHLTSLGLEDLQLDLSGAGSEETAVDIVREAAAKSPPGTWIVGRGWDQNRWPSKAFPDKGILDAAAPGRAVFLTRVDGHAVWVSSAAMAQAGLAVDAPDPEGGRILRGADGRPTGILLDAAIGLVEKAVPPPTRAEKKEAIVQAAGACVAAGLTMVHDAGVDGETVGIYRELIDEGKLPLRVYAMIDWEAKDRAGLIEAGPVVAWKNRLWLRAVKFFADGALGSRGAALAGPYADDPGNAGILAMEESAFAAAVTKVVAAGFQPAVHAIGDRAVHMATLVYSEAVKAFPRKDLRPRIEHVQVLSPGDAETIGASGIIAVMQPVHCTSDMAWAESRLGPQRAALAYAWRKILGAGAVLASGSDFPVESPNPFWGLHAAVTRQDRKGYPAGGWHPEQRMTLEEALGSFTLAGARASFNETVLGSIEKGKFADFVILGRDIFSTPAGEIFGILPTMTVVDGVIAYAR
jgi:predicted amidohydrolase YtcJ